MNDYPTHIVRDLRHKAIGASEKAILFAIADRMQSQMEWVWPSLETIAADAGLSEVQCRRILKWMHSVGIIVERIGEHKAKDRRIDFERLVSFPTDVDGPTRVSPGGGRLSRRTLSPGESTLSRSNHGESPRVSPGESMGITVNPEGPKKEPEKEPEKAQSAREARTGGGAVLTLDFGTSQPAFAATEPDAREVVSARKPIRMRKTTDARATRWPEGFELDAEMIAYATDRGMGGPKQAADEFERFRNYHQSKGSKFVVWNLAWYTWVRNWEDRRNRGSPPQRRDRMTSMQSEGPLLDALPEGWK